MHRDKMDFRQPGPKKHLQGQSAQAIFVIIYHSDLWITLVEETYKFEQNTIKTTSRAVSKEICARRRPFV